MYKYIYIYIYIYIYTYIYYICICIHICIYIYIGKSYQGFHCWGDGSSHPPLAKNLLILPPPPSRLPPNKFLFLPTKG